MAVYPVWLCRRSVGERHVRLLLNILWVARGVESHGNVLYDGVFGTEKYATSPYEDLLSGGSFSPSPVSKGRSVATPQYV
ncbi:hypothetical protein EV126DRAFT_419808 [Verticillium dahliae]|nr:hypothetical protein EV126DRAFT_419808 [Verticillium dahliae]